MFQREEKAGYLHPNDKFLYLGVAMTRATAYIILVTILILILSMIAPTAHSETEKYYIYEFSHQIIENGELTFNYTIVLKLVRVNDTAYKVEVLRYSGPESIKRLIEVWIKTRKNLTGGLEIVRGGLLPIDIFSLPIPIHKALWIAPEKFTSGKEAAAKLMETANKLCNMGNSGNSREDTNKRRDLVRKLYEENKDGIQVLEGVFLTALNKLLQFDLVAAGLYEETKYICNDGFSISVNELKDAYLFKLTLSKTTSSHDQIITGKTIYAKSGWLISSTYRENVNSKNKDNPYTRKVIETIRLVDTNDETVKSVMESVKNIEGSTGSGLLPSIPVSTETVAVGVGVVAVLALIGLALKKLL